MVIDRRPRVVVVGEDRAERRNPSAGRGDVGLDAAILAWAATGKIGDDLLPLVIDAEAKTVVIRRAGRDDIFRDGRAVNGLHRGAGVARAEFQHVGLFSGHVGIGVAHERVELGGVQIIFAAHVVAPRVRADISAVANRVLRERGVARRREITAGPVEDALDHEVRAGGHAQAPELAVVVFFTGGRVARHDARDMRAVTVLVARVGKTAPGGHGVHAARHVGMQIVDVAGI